MMLSPSALLILLLVIQMGCVAAKTTVVEKNNKCADGGIVYYLPEKKVILSVTVDDKGKITAVDAKASDPIPAIKENYEFCGSFHRNLFAENTADFQITPSGLLTVSDAESKSKVSEALKALATTAAGMTAILRTEEQIKQAENCAPGREHTTIVDPVDDKDSKDRLNLCGIQFEIKGPGKAESQRNATVEPGTYSGIFYRQDMPYTVSVVSTASGSPIIRFSKTLFAPNSSPIRYLPFDWNFFADSSATLRFTGGVPTQYKEKIGSEAVGLLSLPADVLDAYFTALGGMFTKIATAATNKTTADTTGAAHAAAMVNAEMKRISAEQKLLACQQAIASKDPAKISAACQ